MTEAPAHRRTPLIPAKAGIQCNNPVASGKDWVPASAGTSGVGNNRTATKQCVSL